MHEQHTSSESRRGCGPTEGASWQFGFGDPRGHRFHQHRGPHFGPHGFGPHGRARRGNVRAAVLAVLAERPMHGYEIMQELESRSSGFWRPSPGSIYPTLQLLEDQGFVKGEDVEGKRVFSLTDEGKAEAQRITEQGEPWAASAGGPEGARFRLRQGVFQLVAAVKQVGVTGTPEQVDAALEILAEARKRVYALLAEAE
ncbi:MAG TPA: PadR family transcriptional regulator [Thermoleophilia bacterium]|nr:PadR family transcriptional regulator [Thermoleophilia bacterium]